MIVVWLFDLVSFVYSLVTALIPGSWTISFPSGVNISIPVPFMSSGSLTTLNAWGVVALAVAAFLIIGRVLMWIYRMVPFNG